MILSILLLFIDAYAAARYTSPDLVTWTDRGDPLPMEGGTLWIPNVIYHEQRKLFIMWYGSGVWGSATST